MRPSNIIEIKGLVTALDLQICMRIKSLVAMPIELLHPWTHFRTVSCLSRMKAVSAQRILEAARRT